MAYLMAAASKDFKAAITWYGGSCFRPWGEAPTPFERTAADQLPDSGPLRRNRSRIRRWRTWRKLDCRTDQTWQSPTIFTSTKTPDTRSWTRTIRINTSLSRIGESWRRGRWSFLRKHLAVQWNLLLGRCSVVARPRGQTRRFYPCKIHTACGGITMANQTERSLSARMPPA